MKVRPLCVVVFESVLGCCGVCCIVFVRCEDWDRRTPLMRLWGRIEYLGHLFCRLFGILFFGMDIDWEWLKEQPLMRL